jgi:hypothetical protein
MSGEHLANQPVPVLENNTQRRVISHVDTSVHWYEPVLAQHRDAVPQGATPVRH